MFNKKGLTLIELTVVLRRVFCVTLVSVVGTIAMADFTDPSVLQTEGIPYDLYDNIVSTSVFHWYTAYGGQVSGPWRPLDGRSNWTGKVDWWKSQIKQTMTANIDVLYVHLIPYMEQQRINLFAALSQMRTEGYDVPKVAPFLDPLITWDIYGSTPDLATTAGKDEFVGEYIRFFNQYFSVNTDPYADSYIAQIDGRVVLDIWHAHLNFSNVSSLTSQDVVSRLSAEFGSEHPIFNNGIYMVGTIGSALSFEDEQVAQFQYHSYYDSRTYNGITTAQVKGGYWDQNVRDPGYWLARSGGANYVNAWNSVNSTANLKRVYIESWNEYDEGSGVYAVDVDDSPYLINGRYYSPGSSGDTWSSTNDPWEYIKTTATGAGLFNETQDYDSSILWHDLPRTMRIGEVRSVTVIVRNEGDLSWTEAADFRFGQKESLAGEVLFGPARYLIDDLTNEIPFYGGIFRGRPITFEFDLIAPDTAGFYVTHWGMLRENMAWFGDELQASIRVRDPGNIYVDDDAAGDPGPGDSSVSDPAEDGTVDHPFDTIQEAIDDALPSGDWVIVYPGTYSENINFNCKNIVLTSTDPDDADVVGNTIIDGGGIARVVTFCGTETSGCVLSGFTITNGHIFTAHGGGIFGANCTATISRCVVENNVASDGVAVRSGGGLKDCDGLINRCIIRNNMASYGGGIATCDGRIENCLVYDNSAANFGGGIHNSDGDIVNCTVVNNSAASDAGGITYCDGTVTNCIVWNNSHAQLYSNLAAVTYNCIDDWSGGGEGNIGANPLFSDMVNEDYHLLPSSPCIDAGDPFSDWSNEFFPNGSRANMGAYGNTSAATKRANLNDLAILVSQWLQSPDTPSADLAPEPGGDGTVNLLDFSVLAEYWLP